MIHLHHIPKCMKLPTNGVSVSFKQKIAAAGFSKIVRDNSVCRSPELCRSV